MLKLLGRLLCALGFHSFEITDVTMGFGPAGDVARVKCRRCGVVTSRPA